VNDIHRGCRRRDPDLQVSLAKAVRFLRVSKSLTQSVLAESAGISQSALSLVEKGERIDISTLKRIATALGIALSQLIEVAEDGGDAARVADIAEAFVKKHAAV